MSKINRRGVLGGAAALPSMFKAAAQDLDVALQQQMPSGDLAQLCPPRRAAHAVADAASAAVRSAASKHRRAAQFRQERSRLVTVRPSIVAMRSWSDAAKLQAEVEARIEEQVDARLQEKLHSRLRDKIAKEFGLDTFDLDYD